MDELRTAAEAIAKQKGGALETFAKRTEPDGSEFLVVLVNHGIGGIKKEVVPVASLPAPEPEKADSKGEGIGDKGPETSIPTPEPVKAKPKGKAVPKAAAK